AEGVQLGAQELARVELTGARRTDVLAAEANAQLGRRLDGADCAVESRVEPRPQERRFGARAADADLLLADRRPELRQLDAPLVGASPGDVRGGRPLEDPREVVVCEL